MAHTLSKSEQDYIRVIFDLITSYGSASTSQIAIAMEVTPASVTGMLKKLASKSPPLLLYTKHKGVNLTPTGERVGLEVTRYHRLLELYLYQELSLPWHKVHDEADALEHAISPLIEKQIAEKLGNPQFDPHGDPIPDHNLNMPQMNFINLKDFKMGQTGVIRRVRDSNESLMEYLYGKRLIPGTPFMVKEISQFDGNMTLELENEVVTLGPIITEMIFAEADPTDENQQIQKRVDK